MKTKHISNIAFAATLAAFSPSVIAEEVAPVEINAEVTSREIDVKVKDVAEAGSEAQVAEASTSMIEEGSLTTTIRDSVTFSILTKALKAAELDSVLGQKGSYTIFAPTDEAFTKLDTKTLDRLMLPENKEKLRSLLLFHVVPGNLMAADLKEGEVKTMNGEKFTVDIEGDGDIEINEARVSSPDVKASNGVMHSVGNVLVPSSLDEFVGLED